MDYVSKDHFFMLSCFEKTANCEDIPRNTRTWNHPKNRELQIREIRIRELRGLPVQCYTEMRPKIPSLNPVIWRVFFLCQNFGFQLWSHFRRTENCSYLIVQNIDFFSVKSLMVKNLFRFWFWWMWLKPFEIHSRVGPSHSHGDRGPRPGLGVRKSIA